MVERHRHEVSGIDLRTTILTPEQLIARGAEMMADYQEMDRGVTDRDVISFMLELFDNPIAIEALEREMQRRAGGRDVDRWH